MKPMLAAKTDGGGLRYPLLASPKLDGVRCLIAKATAFSRTLKPIPNHHVQATLGKPAINGWDGELIVGSPCAPDVYRQTTSGVMAAEGEPNFCFHAFDRYDLRLPFYRRLEKITQDARSVPWLTIVPHTVITDWPQLAAFEQDCLAAGYEGVMLRDPEAPYKEGRSTSREGWLLKLKRFEDSEAVVMEVVELMHNDNEAKTNALGKTERSSHKANKRGGDTMGSLRVKDVHTAVEFDIGTGFDAATRKEIWQRYKHYTGKILKYKFFPGGVKDKPRFPVFLGWRDAIDII